MLLFFTIFNLPGNVKTSTCKTTVRCRFYHYINSLTFSIAHRLSDFAMLSWVWVALIFLKDRHMQTIEKIEQCSYCDGRGWREITEFDGGHRTELGKRGCTDCGGKGEIYHSWHIKHLKKYGLSPHISAPFREGSGKLRTFYQVTSENCKSKSCHG